MEIKCQFCNKSLSRSDSLKRHESNCNKKEDVIKKIAELEKEIKTLKTKNQTKNITKNIINNNNNGTIINNNIYINPPGKENPTLFTLTNEDVKEIFNENINCIIKYIEKRNFNTKLIENHSFCVTSRDGKHLLTYDTDSNIIESQRKKYFLDTIITQAIKEIENLYKKHKNTFVKSDQRRIEENIQSLKDYNEKGYENKIYRELLNELNLQIYNKCGIILNTWIKILGVETLKKYKISNLVMNEEEDIFIMPENIDNDDSDTSSVKKLIPVIKKKEIITSSDDSSIEV
jgi:hypothetical protein